MKIMKYVRHERGFALIPDMGDSPAHIELAELIVGNVGGKMLSAGFVKFKDGKPECFGRSQSMGMGSVVEDSDLLAEQLGLK